MWLLKSFSSRNVNGRSAGFSEARIVVEGWVHRPAWFRRRSGRGAETSLRRLAFGIDAMSGGVFEVLLQGVVVPKRSIACFTSRASVMYLRLLKVLLKGSASPERTIAGRTTRLAADEEEGRQGIEAVELLKIPLC